MIIDPPTSFDSLSAWQAFLADMKTIKNPDADVKRYIAQAEIEISVRQNRNG